MNSEDNKLVQDFLAGETQAFEKLLQKYLKQTFNFLYHLVPDRTILDDLTQETFVKVWKNLKRFDQSKNFRTWVFAIAKNTAYDYLKKKKTIPFSSFEDDEGFNRLEKISDDNLLVDKIWESKELANNLDKKLKEISEPYRTLLLWHYKDDLSLQEIAEILGKPYNTIKSQHQRALQTLKKVIEKNDR